MRLYPASSSFGAPHADLTAANAQNRELIQTRTVPMRLYRMSVAALTTFLGGADQCSEWV